MYAVDLLIYIVIVLVDARDDGTFTAGALNTALAVLDADQIILEPKGAQTDYAQAKSPRVTRS